MKTFNGKVLVVDDDEPIRRMCERILSNLGIAVKTTENAQEALTLLEHASFDCVLTDISMPGLKDGEALTKDIKDRFPATDVIVMTGNPTVKTSVSTLTSGALDYLTKPFDPAVLQSAITHCLEHRRLTAELNAEKSLRLELEAAYQELQKTQRGKDALLSIVGHELKTPLAIAGGAAELLEDESLTPEGRGFLEKIRSSLAREKAAVENLLSFAALRAAGVDLRKSWIDLNGMLERLVEEYKPVWEKKNLSLAVSIPAAIKPFWGDAELLNTTFKQLLLNAIQFNRQNGSVQIIVEDEPGQVSLSFVDTGIGIPPEEFSRAFDSFYQVADYMTRTVGGLGLGLAIVRRAVEAHGGDVGVSSQPGFGSDFKVTLPKRAAVATVRPNRIEGIITVCSHCRRLRDNKSSYLRMEVYFQKNFHFTFSHGLCPDCMEQHYPE